MEEGEELTVGGGEALRPAELQGEDVVNDPVNAVSTGHALGGARHWRLSLLSLYGRKNV